MKICPGCGKNCNDSSAFCGFCGFPLKDVKPIDENNAAPTETNVPLENETVEAQDNAPSKETETSDSNYTGDSIYSNYNSDQNIDVKNQAPTEPVFNNKPDVFANQNYNNAQSPNPQQNYNNPQNMNPQQNFNQQRFNNPQQNFGSAPNYNNPQNFNSPNYNPQQNYNPNINGQNYGNQNYNPNYSSHVPDSGTQSDPYSVASLVLGIVGLIFSCCYIGIIPSILATIFSFVAKNRIKASEKPVNGTGLATAGLVLGIIGLAIFFIALIVSITGGSMFTNDFADSFEKGFEKGYNGARHYTDAMIGLSMLFHF